MASIIPFIILILILVDVFLANEAPTHIAYILTTIFIVIELQISILNKVFVVLPIWFSLLVFHYLIWRRFIEKIHDSIISPQKHIGGIEGLIGESGIITEINGSTFILINEELYEFMNETNKEIVPGRQYEILQTTSNKLII